MTFPNLLPISHIPDYHTQHVGKWSGGQYMGFVVAGFPGQKGPEDFQGLSLAEKRWYSVLHLFDAKGNHLRTLADFHGTTDDGEREVVERAEARLLQMLEALGKITQENIAIRMFQFVKDEVLFGLVAETYEADDRLVERITLMPADLAFFEPWDGDYDT